jgi:hypothetical protein
MTQIILSESQWADWQNGPVPVQVCDPKGRIVAVCYPIVPADSPLYSKHKSPLSEEELALRRQETGGKPLAEFWREMGRGT